MKLLFSLFGHRFWVDKKQPTPEHLVNLEGFAKTQLGKEKQNVYDNLNLLFQIGKDQIKEVSSLPPEEKKATLEKGVHSHFQVTDGQWCLIENPKWLLDRYLSEEGGDELVSLRINFFYLSHRGVIGIKVAIPFSSLSSACYWGLKDTSFRLNDGEVVEFGVSIDSSLLAEIFIPV